MQIYNENTDIQCLSCKKYDHELFSCPYLHYVKNHILCARKHFFSKEIE
jgi:hypothetical protein